MSIADITGNMDFTKTPRADDHETEIYNADDGGGHPIQREASHMPDFGDRDASYSRLRESHTDVPNQSVSSHASRINNIATANTSTKQLVTTPREENEEIIMKAKFDNLQTECKSLRNQVLELQRNVQEAHDFIFSLQPAQQPLTEAGAAEEFKTLCESVEAWVENNLGEPLQNNIRPSHTIKAAHMLLGLVTIPGTRAFNHRDTDEYNIVALILCLLCDKVFSDHFFAPLHKDYREFLSSIETDMGSLSPERDFRTRRTWRSETYTAIFNNPEFNQTLEQMQSNLTSDLIYMLRPFTGLPDVATHNLSASIKQNIIQPAFSLARKMHLSVDKYNLEWSPYYNSLQDVQLSDYHFKHFQFFNLLNSKQIKSPPSEGAIQWLFDITPRLVVRKVLPDYCAEPKTLVEPKILISFREGHHEDQQVESPYNPDLTVLGRLQRSYERRVRERQTTRSTGNKGSLFGAFARRSD